MSLAIEDIGVRLGGRDVLRDIRLEARAGELLALLGTNGAGKSTLLRVVAGLQAADTGRVLLDGEVLPERRPQELARRIGYLPQDARCHWPLAVHAVVALGRLPHRRAWQPLGQDDRRAVEAAMRAADVAHLAARPVDAISGGERARVLLARVLAGEPEVVLADEPVSGLDPGHQIEVMRMLEALAGRGATVVVVLHDLTLAARYAHRVALLEGQRLRATGPPEAVLSDDNLRACFGIRVFRGHDGAHPFLVPLEGLRGER